MKNKAITAKKIHENFMSQALVLAENGLGQTSPNPVVGAIIVKNGKIIATGWHKKAGTDHAEIIALKKISRSQSQGADLYVTLEPCSHHGQTPPCTDSIIAAGIKRVFIASRDPNPLVNGHGIKKLEKARIKVSKGILKKAADSLNEFFMTAMKKNRPFISLKFAMSLDGKIATKTGDSTYITSKKALTYAHHLRKIHDAILVGANTVINDNPRLNCRLVKGRDPLRIIIDPHGKTSEKALVYRDNNVLVVTEKITKHMLNLSKRGVEILAIKPINLQKILEHLHKQKIRSLLVEGGSTTHSHFIAENLYDKIYTFIAPKIIGGKKAMSPVGGIGIEKISQAPRLKITNTIELNPDLLIIAYPKQAHA